MVVVATTAIVVLIPFLVLRFLLLPIRQPRHLVCRRRRHHNRCVVLFLLVPPVSLGLAKNSSRRCVSNSSRRSPGHRRVRPPGGQRHLHLHRQLLVVRSLDGRLLLPPQVPNHRIVGVATNTLVPKLPSPAQPLVLHQWVLLQLRRLLLLLLMVSGRRWRRGVLTAPREVVLLPVS